jgi:hypothetical protein
VFGQGYVALSRVRTLTGLKMLGMSPTALRVDPKIVQVDARFREEAEDAESAFEELGEEETELMHTQFVQACGGTYVSGDIAAPEKKGYERVQKESTYALTRESLLKGNTVSQIAKERSVGETTVWAHLEKLVEDQDVTEAQLAPLVAGVDDWEEVFGYLQDIMDEEGSEKLKPIFVAAEEQYDYSTIRLARMIYILKNGSTA